MTNSSLRYVLVLLCLMIPLVVSSQERAKMDSLLTLLAKYPAQDTTRVNLAFDAFWIMLDFNPDSCRLLCQEGMDLSHTLDYSKGICRGYLSEGIIAKVLEQDLEKAKVKYDSALLYAQKTAHPKFLGAWHNNLGQIFSDRALARELRVSNGRIHESKGLKITEERLLLYDQKHGTRSTVMTTDLYNDGGKPIGTSVKIWISSPQAQ